MVTFSEITVVSWEFFLGFIIRWRETRGVPGFIRRPARKWTGSDGEMRIRKMCAEVWWTQ
jgi:hypothetical protein